MRSNEWTITRRTSDSPAFLSGPLVQRLPPHLLANREEASARSGRRIFIASMSSVLSGRSGFLRIRPPLGIISLRGPAQPHLSAIDLVAGKTREKAVALPTQRAATPWPGDRGPEMSDPLWPRIRDPATISWGSAPRGLSTRSIRASIRGNADALLARETSFSSGNDSIFRGHL